MCPSSPFQDICKGGKTSISYKLGKKASKLRVNGQIGPETRLKLVFNCSKRCKMRPITLSEGARHRLISEDILNCKLIN